MPKFEIVSNYQPSGDQPEAIDKLARGVELGLPERLSANALVALLNKRVAREELFRLVSGMDGEDPGEK